MQAFELSLFADYYQFYIQDETATGPDGSVWNDEASSRMFGHSDGIVMIGTYRNTDVPVRIEVWDTPPELDTQEWDRMGECSLLVQSGILVVAGCTDYSPDANRISVEKGAYRVRISHGGADSVAEDGLDGDDRYRVQLWPSDMGPSLILKQPDP